MRCATVLSGAAVSAPAPELVVFAPTAVAAGCASGRLAAAVAVSEPPDWLRVVVELAAVSQAARTIATVQSSASIVILRIRVCMYLLLFRLHQRRYMDKRHFPLP